jgi:glc operon protein GlcG
VPITLQQAQAIIRGAHQRAAAIGIRVTVAVVDEGGHLQALARMDGSFPLSPQIAEAKAVGAALWLRDGAALRAASQERPHFFAQVDRLARTPLMPALGSVLVRSAGQVLGAVGVSGASGEEDLECAQAGLRACGFPTGDP